MNKVLSRVNILVLILYILVGTFGYLTFATAPDNLTDPRYGGIIIVFYIFFCFLLINYVMINKRWLITKELF